MQALNVRVEHDVQVSAVLVTEKTVDIPQVQIVEKVVESSEIPTAQRYQT